MSHYRVAVIHKASQDVDELLSPYSENISVAPYIRYTREEAINYARRNYTGYGDKSDDDCWSAVAKVFDMNCDDDGNIYSTYNPKSKWNRYSEIDEFTIDASRRVPIDDIFFPTYAVVLPDGEWYAPGEVGWFGMSTETGEEYLKWENEYNDRFKCAT